MAKKTPAKSAPKTKVTPKAAQSSTRAKKATKSTPVKAKGTKKALSKPKVPGWLHPFPVDYVVGTEDYGKLIDAHNELFGTAWNRFRVRPQVFFTIHEGVWNHYDPEQYKKHRNG